MKYTNYWIKCPTDVKQQIQQYLKYNMLKELLYRTEYIKIDIIMEELYEFYFDLENCPDFGRHFLGFHPDNKSVYHFRYKIKSEKVDKYHYTWNIIKYEYE